MTTLEEYLYNASPLRDHHISGSTHVGSVYVYVGNNKSIKQLILTTVEYHKRIVQLELYENGIKIVQRKFDKDGIMNYVDYDDYNVESKITKQPIPYCLTEEEYFQNSLLYNLSDFTVNDFKACWYCYQQTLNRVQII